MRWIAHPDVVWVESGEEIRLYDTAAGEFQSLNSSAAAVWRQLLAHGRQGAVVEALALEFGAKDEDDRDRIRRDVEQFLQQIASAGLIVRQSSDAG